MARKLFRTGTAVSAAAPVVMFPAVPKATPVVTAYRCTGDDAGATFKIYTGGASKGALVTAANATTLLMTSTAGFTAGDKVLLYDASTGTCYWNSVASVSADPVALELDAVTGFAVVAADIVYRMDVVASLPCASATVANNGGYGGIAFGNKSAPIAGAVVDGTAANVITGFSVTYHDATGE